MKKINTILFFLFFGNLLLLTLFSKTAFADGLCFNSDYPKWCSNIEPEAVCISNEYDCDTYTRCGTIGYVCKSGGTINCNNPSKCIYANPCQNQAEGYTKYCPVYDTDICIKPDYDCSTATSCGGSYRVCQTGYTVQCSPLACVALTPTPKATSTPTPTSTPIPTSTPSPTPTSKPTPTPTPKAKQVNFGITGPDVNLAFITSEKYTGNLKDAAQKIYPSDSTIKTGLAGADAICKFKAAEAGLMGTYKAWLSDSLTSASDRLIHSPDPYIRIIDGYKIADDWYYLIGGKLNGGLSTENGNWISSSLIWTGTQSNGNKKSNYSSDFCNDWTNNFESIYGFSGSTEWWTSKWTDSGKRSCDNQFSLYCFRQPESTNSSPTNAPTPIPRYPKKVFVTSQSYNGNLGGLSGADQKCQSLANTAGLSGTYKAWLSSSNVDVSSRLTHSTNPYKLVNGTTIANSWDDLLTNKSGNFLLSAINRDENGNTVSYSGIWTNTDSNGLRINSDPTYACSDWNSSASNSYAKLGSAINTGRKWTNYGLDAGTVALCTASYASHLYCFEQ